MKTILLRLSGMCLALLLAFAAGGCGMRQGGTLSIATPDFFGIAEDLATQLEMNSRRPMGGQRRLVMTSFVEIDDLYATSRFGRTLTEAVAARLFRHGFGMIEVRKSSDILVKPRAGELMLSREARLLSGVERADGVVVGTYSLTPQSVIISIRLLDSASQDVISVADMELQRSQAINHLLLSGSASFGGSAGGGNHGMKMSSYER